MCQKQNMLPSLPVGRGSPGGGVHFQKLEHHSQYFVSGCDYCLSVLLSPLKALGVLTKQREIRQRGQSLRCHTIPSMGTRLFRSPQSDLPSQDVALISRNPESSEPDCSCVDGTLGPETPSRLCWKPKPNHFSILSYYQPPKLNN